MKPDRTRNWPSRERPRERLIAEGPERLTDAELLAIVLRVGRGTFKKRVPGETALTLARSLLREREKACQLATAVEQEVEEMILGIRPILIADGQLTGET